MSTNEPPLTRPRPDEVRPTASGLIQRIRDNASSIRQGLLLAGVGGIVLGGLIWIFIRDLAGAALIVVAAGAVLLLIDALISWRAVSKFVFGRGGRYGVNSVSVLLGVIAIAIAANYVLFWAGSRPNPPGFLRVDTTYTKQFLLEDQVKNTLKNMKEPVRVTAFFPSVTSQQRTAWRNTEDMLLEFKRNSTVHSFDYRQIDPDLNPTEASRYGVTSYPSLVVEGMQSQRRQIIPSQAAPTSVNAFTEQELVTGLLVVNEIQQKQVMFISGHSERDVIDIQGPEGFGLARLALQRENYFVTNGTMTELGVLISSGDPTLFPAAVVIANPRQDMTAQEEAILVQYARMGGSLMFLFEPDAAPDTFLAFLSRYGIAIGAGEVVDTASFVPPNPRFLQAKRSNQQFPPHEVTQAFDVVYLPGSTYIATTIDPATVPLTETGVPYVFPRVMAQSTLSSWAETSLDGEISFTQGEDRPGPLPLAISVEAIAELSGAPSVVDGRFVETNIIVIGDADFAANQAFSSAKNGDLFVNSVNWLVEDFQLITIRPKQAAYRELVLTQTERDFVRWSGWLLMPSLIGITGVWAWWRRR